MNWSFIGVLIPTVCYLITAAAQASKGNLSNAFIFLGYSLANLGFLWQFSAH